MRGRLLDVNVCRGDGLFLTIFGGSSTESGVVWMRSARRMEGVRNVLKVSELKLEKMQN